MTDKEVIFFKEYLDTNLISPKLLHRAVPKYSEREYNKLIEKKNKETVTKEYKWNFIRFLYYTLMNDSPVDHSMFLSVVNLNRTLFFEFYTYDTKSYIKKPKPISRSAFKRLLKNQS